MRSHFIWALVVAFALSTFQVKAADWSIDIMPENSNEKGGQSINIWRTFYVVITNTSTHDLVLWNEWCSWGYFNLSFECVDKTGKVVKVQKNSTGFTQNFPSEYVVKSGKHFVLPIKFLDFERKDIKEWSNTGDLRDTMTMKAIYKNTNEAFPGEKPNSQDKNSDNWQKLIDSAWVGQVESEPIQVTIVR